MKHLTRKAAAVVIGTAVAVSTIGLGAASAGVTKTGVTKTGVTKTGVTKTGIVKVPIGPVNGLPIQRYITPSANLDAVANALTLRTKSVNTLVALPAGLNVTKPVTVSIWYDNAPGQPQSYVRSSGNRFLQSFPAGNGQALYKPIRVHLTEQVSATRTNQYDVFWNPLVQPLYDIRVSPLNFTLNQDCDWVGDSEPVVVWSDPKGVTGSASYSLDAGDRVTVNGFARTYTEVGQLAGLKLPSVDWFEDDPFSLGAVAPAPSGQLALVNSYTYNRTLDETTGQDCKATLKYSVTKTLRFYPYL